MSDNWERALIFLAGVAVGTSTLIAVAMTITNLDAIGCC